MKRLVATVALCLVAAPAHALDSAYPKPSEVRALLPTATVEVPPFYSPTDKRVTARLEAQLGVPSLTMAATSLKMPGYRFNTYVWQTPTMRVSAQRMVFVKGSAQAYARTLEQSAKSVRKIDGVTVLGNGRATLGLRPIDSRRLVLVTLLGNKPRRAADVVQAVAQESAVLERSQPRFVARYATAMVGWELVMVLNDPQSPIGDFSPRVRQRILRLLASDADLDVSQAHYAKPRFQGPCLALTPRNGSTSEPVHLVLDANPGARSRAIELGYGPCS